MSSLRVALDGIGPAPCEGCVHADYCAAGAACRVFAYWLDDGKLKEQLGREPTSQEYERIFGPKASRIRQLSGPTEVTSEGNPQ